VGTVGIVGTCMVTTFPVPRFFFGIVGRAISTVGKQGAVGRNPPVNFEDAPLRKLLITLQSGVAIPVVSLS